MRCLDPGLATGPPSTVKLALSARRGTFLQTLFGKGTAIRWLPDLIAERRCLRRNARLGPPFHGLRPTLAVLESGFL